MSKEGNRMEKKETSTDVIMIGAGIMSATLGTMLKEVEPGMDIQICQTLAQTGKESTNASNNAGTAHSALCEWNYTNEREDGSIDTTKAVKINEEFVVAKQVGSYLVKEGLIVNPGEFI